MCAALMRKPDTITTCDAHHLCKQHYKDFPVFMDWPFNWPLIGPQLAQLDISRQLWNEREQRREINCMNGWKMTIPYINQSVISHSQWCDQQL